MLSRVGITFAICLMIASSVGAQVVRFETSLGDFDMVLNPTNNPLLQAHVDNMLLYVEDNRYSSSWINRADTGFVLQMGGFYSHTRRPPPTIDSTRAIVTFDPVLGEPASTISGLSNTIGTVSLALPGDGMGGTNQDAGTSSFFVNLTSNAFLDANFTVFAAIPDMTVVNQIMALTTIDRTADPNFGAGSGNLGFTDVPIMDNGQQVFIKRAYEIQDAMSVARARAGVESTMALSAANSGSGAEANSSLVSTSSATVVPEPASLLIATIGSLSIGFLARRRR